MENFPLGKLLANALLSCVLFHNIKKKKKKKIPCQHFFTGPQ